MSYSARFRASRCFSFVISALSSPVRCDCANSCETNAGGECVCVLGEVCGDVSKGVASSYSVHVCDALAQLLILSPEILDECLIRALVLLVHDEIGFAVALCKQRRAGVGKRAALITDRHSCSLGRT